MPLPAPVRPHPSFEQHVRTRAARVDAARRAPSASAARGPPSAALRSGSARAAAPPANLTVRVVFRHYARRRWRGEAVYRNSRPGARPSRARGPRLRTGGHRIEENRGAAPAPVRPRDGAGLISGGPARERAPAGRGPANDAGGCSIPVDVLLQPGATRRRGSSYNRLSQYLPYTSHVYF